MLQVSDARHVLEASVRSSIPSACAVNTTAVEGYPFTTMLLHSVMTDSETDDNAQSILEEHVSRVWESSNGPTPGATHSPGLQTPNHAVIASRGLVTAGCGMSSKGHGGPSKSSGNRTKDDLLWHEERVRNVRRHGASAMARESRHGRQHIMSSRVDGTAGPAVDVDARRPATRRSMEPAHSSSAANSNASGMAQDSLETTKDRYCS